MEQKTLGPLQIYTILNNIQSININTIAAFFSVLFAGINKSYLYDKHKEESEK